MTVDAALDELYALDPAEFTARRGELVAAAKRRGDADDARSIAAVRRPTTAAWVVNTLVRADDTAKTRLAELGERLRAAHAAMDGARIRESSAAQRKLIDQLVRAGFDAVGMAQPSAALRDDVVGTLQAAVADPDVAARLGRLEKAERWSGFGEFGTVTAVGRAPTSTATSEVARAAADPRAVEAELAAARERAASARRDADAARQAHADAVDATAVQKAKLAKARRRYEKLLESLDAAEQEVNAADERFAAAEQAERAAADRRDAALSAATLAESELEELVGRQAP
ncbi:hypothetical protein [Mycolicibacterium sp. 050158]|uniref:hypothetical protein n=1 Tax=Mycolicibacterium sp. 050158 TaxID=3090602 RepID=UPI00299F1B0A|nr:hypothetical protein [Mycolicibacterium sp. 050158]MDX1889296.1 hypothetical protein [Mycolicibacterium sp. 050158]